MRTKLFCVIATCFLALLTLHYSDAKAAAPEAVSMSLSGIQRGTSAEITISGARLGDAHSLVFFSPGLTASNITKVDDNNIKVTVAASADVTCDLHPFRVVTNTGLSNIRLLYRQEISAIRINFT